jgi:hypothetical protein
MLILMIGKVIADANSDIAADSADSQRDFDASRDLEADSADDHSERRTLVTLYSFASGDKYNADLHFVPFISRKPCEILKTPMLNRLRRFFCWPVK